MSYNSARDELFLADDMNKVVRAMRVRDSAGDLRDVYRCAPHDTSQHIDSVCYMSDSDTLFVWFVRKRAEREVIQLAGGTEPQRQRVARDAPPGDRQKRT